MLLQQGFAFKLTCILGVLTNKVFPFMLRGAETHWSARNVCLSQNSKSIFHLWAVEDSDETLDTLGSRLETILEQVEASYEQSPMSACFDDPRQELLSTRLKGLQLNRTYVDASTIAGRGLFAKDNYPKNTLLTCYPGDALVLLSKDEVHWGKHVDSDLQNPENVDQEYMLRAVSEDWGIVALADLSEDPAYLGHFANDGADKPPCSEAELSMYVL